jgi:hypothetical protein
MIALHILIYGAIPRRVDREPVAVVDKWRSAGVTFCRRAIPKRVDTLCAEPSG